MKILFASSEVAPFIKTGGLADVAGSLPAELARAGHEVRVILPLYEGVGSHWREEMRFVRHFNVRVAWRTPYCGIFELEHGGVTYWFVDNEYYFLRTQVYGHYDDGERFAFFSRAVIETVCQLDWAPDIIHANDWQTALVPIYLLEERQRIPLLAHTKSVFTIHNIEYQGRYGDHVLEDLLGLSRAAYFHDKMLEYHGDVNLMKGAIYAADFVTTVSPSYAEELRLAFYGKGLDGVIRANSDKIAGILNGLDVALYDPAQESAIAKNFSIRNMTGKALCKAELQRAVGLNEAADTPVIACVSRLAEHKGFDLLLAVLHDVMALDVQIVVLGTGEWRYEEALRNAAGQYPGRFSAQLVYSAPLSTAIYAGADLFLMPSISEPCGLSQMIAMRFGTLPIVRETGGLRDSVLPYNQFTGEGTGFSFADVNPADMLYVIREAVALYHDDPKTWKALRRHAMTTDFSWAQSSIKYLEIYKKLTEN